jgi:hypothetical protein
MPDGYNSDVWEPGQQAWKRCVTIQELETLKSFNSAYGAEVSDLPTTEGWQGDPGWQRVSQAAEAALQRLNRSSSASLPDCSWIRGKTKLSANEDRSPVTAKGGV